MKKRFRIRLVALGLFLMGIPLTAALKPVPVSRLPKAIRDNMHGMDSSSWPRLRALAVRRLGNMGPAAALAVPQIIGLLKDPHWSVRYHAVLALGKIKDRRAVALVGLCLRDTSPMVRAAACRALGQLHAREKEEDLLRSLRDNDARVQAEAARGLAALQSKRAVDYLCHGLKDRGVKKVIAYIEALGDIGDDKAVKPLLTLAARHETAPAVLTALGKIKHPTAVNDVARLLGDGRYPFQAEAARCLGEIGHPLALPALRTAMTSPSWRLRMYAAEALGKINTAKAVSVLAVAIKDKDPKVREQACAALGRYGGSLDTAVLHSALTDESAPVRIAALTALGRVGEKKDIAALSALSKEKLWQVRYALVTAVGRLALKTKDAKRKQWTSFLTAYLQDKDRWVRKAAARALRRLTGRAIRVD